MVLSIAIHIYTHTHIHTHARTHAHTHARTHARTEKKRENTEYRRFIPSGHVPYKGVQMDDLLPHNTYCNYAYMNKNTNKPVTVCLN